MIGADEDYLQECFREDLPKSLVEIETQIELMQEKLEDLGANSSQRAAPKPDFWEDLHATICKYCKKKFEDGHFADAVETGFKALNERVKNHVKRQSSKELDGSSLMQHAFSPHNPIIVLADQSTQSGKDEQLGYMNIFSGVMQGIRNPKAHGNITISSERAKHLLYLASLLMYRLDDSGTGPLS